MALVETLLSPIVSILDFNSTSVSGNAQRFELLPRGEAEQRSSGHQREIGSKTYCSQAGARSLLLGSRHCDW